MVIVGCPIILDGMKFSRPHRKGQRNVRDYVSFLPYKHLHISEVRLFDKLVCLFKRLINIGSERK